MTDRLTDGRSRPDNSSGDPSVFDPEVFEETLQYWPDPIVSVRQGAAARLGRIRTSAGTNVDFEMRLEDNFRGLGEVAGFYLTLGDRVAGTVNRTWLTYFLGTFLLFLFFCLPFPLFIRFIITFGFFLYSQSC